MTEKWIVTLHLVLDREKNLADPPGEWQWASLLDLRGDESVGVASFMVGMDRGN